jgi:hypothetical protein
MNTTPRRRSALAKCPSTPTAASILSPPHSVAGGRPGRTRRGRRGPNEALDNRGAGSAAGMAAQRALAGRVFCFASWVMRCSTTQSTRPSHCYRCSCNAEWAPSLNGPLQGARVQPASNTYSVDFRDTSQPRSAFSPNSTSNVCARACAGPQVGTRLQKQETRRRRRTGGGRGAAQVPDVKRPPARSGAQGGPRRVRRRVRSAGVADQLRCCCCRL